MSILTVTELSKQFAEKVILDKVSFQLAARDRVGLVGANGSGKSTLLEILNRSIDADSGSFHLAQHARVGYLQQSFEPFGQMTVAAWLKNAERDLYEMQARLDALAEQMATARGDNLKEVMSAYGELALRFEERGGYDLPHRIQMVLQGLAIAHLRGEAKVSTLSGGEQVRLGLAAVLIQSPDLLILDEPTNHLDREAMTWLEQYLGNYSGALIVVSHDRWFLNGVVNRILEVDEIDHQVRHYAGNYDAYFAQKNIERTKWETRYQSEQADIRELRQRIWDATNQVGHNRPPKDNNKMAHNRHGAKVQQTVACNIHAAEVQLNRILENAVSRPPEPLRFSASFEAESLHHDVAVSVSNVSSVLANGRTLYQNVGFTLGKRDHMLITGPNGVGKTALLDILAGIQQPTEGSVFRPARTVIGYLRQDLYCVRPEATVLESFCEGLAGTLDDHAAQLLSFQLFRYDEFRLVCGQLSPGQYRKLMIAKLMATGANLLLLDEPTNHISFAILEEFEQALNEFQGAIVAVSHDRRFISQFRGTIWTLENDKLTPPAAQVWSDEGNERMRNEIVELGSYVDTVKARRTRV